MFLLSDRMLYLIDKSKPSISHCILLTCEFGILSYSLHKLDKVALNAIFTCIKFEPFLTLSFFKDSWVVFFQIELMPDFDINETIYRQIAFGRIYVFQVNLIHHICIYFHTFHSIYGLLNDFIGKQSLKIK